MAGKVKLNSISYCVIGMSKCGIYLQLAVAAFSFYSCSVATDDISDRARVLAKKKQEEGKELFEKGFFREAISYFDDAFELNPSCADIM